MSAGLTYLVSYTWSKSLDTTSAIRGTNVDIFPQDSYCLSCDRGYSAFNTPHRFVTSIMYELPFGKGKPLANQGGVVNQIVGGWQIGSIITIQSGRPLNMQAGYDVSGTNHYGEIRLSATGQDPYAANQTANRWFNPAGFTLLGAGHLRQHEPQPADRAQSTIAWDFSTLKNFPIRKVTNLQFRFEAFNFPNHPRLGDPTISWGSRDAAKPGPQLRPDPRHGHHAAIAVRAEVRVLICLGRRLRRSEARPLFGRPPISRFAAVQRMTRKDQ